MYRGFNLTLDYNDETNFGIGKALFNINKTIVRQTLDTFIGKGSTINGTKMQENWFPQIDTDIFISHSHKDEKIAITLAGWLYEEFGLKAFIDSCIWDYSNKLLRMIDDEYCLNSGGETYSYTKRNNSTSHVHMMLSTALSMMIDKTECLFFLNTPNSISASSVVSKTESPWIYSEIAMTQVVSQKLPRRLLRHESRYFSKGGMINEQLRITYDLNLKHLTNLDQGTLVDWQNNGSNENELSALNELYRLKPVKTLDTLHG